MLLTVGFYLAVRTHRDVFIGVKIDAGVLMREERIHLLFASFILHKNRTVADQQVIRWTATTTLNHLLYNTINTIEETK